MNLKNRKHTNFIFDNIEYIGLNQVISFLQTLYSNKEITINKTLIDQIPNIIETSRRFGMHMMDNSIAELCVNGLIDREEAILRSSNRGKMEKLLRQTGRS